MLQLSKDANLNYIAKIATLPASRKHTNADRLQCFSLDFQNVITDLNYKEGDSVVFFPVECVINHSLISFINGFEDKTRNSDPNQKGFFNKHGRVRAISLRGERSQGFVIPLKVFADWIVKDFGSAIIDLDVKEFDTYNGTLICQKYIPYVKQNRSSLKSDKKVVKKISRLVPNQFRLHNDTDNFRRNSDKICPSDIIGIHYKKHGTSWVVGKVLVNRQLKWHEKILKRFGVKIQDTEYDYIYSSRKVVKNEYETKDHQHFFGYDLWADIKEEIKNAIPNGYTLYGELVGYDKNGGMIQKDYDYGCKVGDHKIYIYRITVTNTEGEVLELDDMQILQFCQSKGLLFRDTLIYYGEACKLYPEIDITNHWNENFVKQLEKDYNDKDCYMCNNKVPEEGIVIRKQDAFDYIAYKLKSARFLEKETNDLDAGIMDMETSESLVA